MKTMTRLALTAAGAALVATATVPAAGAAPAAPAQAAPNTYTAGAEATALDIQVLGQGLTIGATEASTTSPGNASASGAGAFLATTPVGPSDAEASAVGQSAGSTTPTCGPLSLPSAVPLVALQSACSFSIASVDDVGPRSEAGSEAVDLALEPGDLLAPLAPVTETVVQQLLDALEPILGQLPAPLPVVVDGLTDTLQEALTGDDALVRVRAGTSSATSSADAETASAAHKATGITITVIERESLGLSPVLTIEVGESSTAVTQNRATGEESADATAAPVKITVAPEIAAILMLPDNGVFTVPEGQTIDLPLPAPLTSSVTVASGSTGKQGEALVAEAGAVDLRLLTGLQGGIVISASRGSSSVESAAPAQQAPPTTATPTAAPAPAPAPPGPAPAPRNLPRTGEEERTLQLIALVLILSAAGITGLVIRSGRRSASTEA